MAVTGERVLATLKSRHLREWLFIAAVATVYSWLRWVVTPDTPAAAVANARDVVAFEGVLGLFIEGILQAPILGNTVLMWTINIYYIGLHLPPIFAALIFTYKFHRAQWPMVRDIMVVFTLAGVLIHALFPLAPPWYMTEFGITDTFDGYREDPISESSAGNPFAAMPSMHFGWALVSGIAFFLLGRSGWVRAFGIAHPTIMGYAIVATGNHYVVDAMASTILLGITLIVVRGFHRAFPPSVSGRPEPHPPHAPAASGHPMGLGPHP